jgi:hypothetical protein
MLTPPVDMGYIYKIPGKRVSDNAPTKEDKLEKVQNIIAEFQDLQNRENYEIFALDKSYFATEPYLLKELVKRVVANGSQRRCAEKVARFWVFQFEDEKILFEQIESR